MRQQNEGPGVQPKLTSGPFQSANGGLQPLTIVRYFPRLRSIQRKATGGVPYPFELTIRPR